MDIKIFIAFCSPSGSTKHVADMIKSGFGRQRVPVDMLDLAKTRDVSVFSNAIKTAGPNACLFVGSPVYRNVAIPPVMR
jgi:flavodoxin